MHYARTLGFGVLALGLSLGCGDDGGGADTDTDTDPSTSGTASTSSTSSTSATSSTSTTMSTSSTTATSSSTDPTTSTTTTSTTTSSESSSGPGSSTSGEPADAEFEEVDGIVSVEAEHYFDQVNNDPTAIFWYTFEDGSAPPDVECVTNTVCNGGNAPDCNQYADCDPDGIDPAEAAGGAYVEALPDRRRDDSEAGTGNLGVVNDPTNSAVLEYRVNFTQTGRYYVWGRARGQGPAANGIHLGLDDTWPDNDLIDPSSMRMQFPNGWQWTQNRRGGAQHTGVSGTDEVSVRDANIWLQIDEPGVHIIRWGMREDGLEFDKFLMALDPDYVPEDDGPPETAL